MALAGGLPEILAGLGKQVVFYLAASVAALDQSLTVLLAAQRRLGHQTVQSNFGIGFTQGTGLRWSGVGHCFPVERVKKGNANTTVAPACYASIALR